MTTKLKLISISLALFLIVALSAALAFALPKEEFNLSGSLSYEPSYQTYTPISAYPLSAYNCFINYYADGTLKGEMGIKSISQNYKAIFNGVINENGLMVFKEYSFQSFNPLTGEKLFPSLKDQRPLMSSSILGGNAGASGFLNENVIFLEDLVFVKENFDSSAVAFVGATERIPQGYDFSLPLQTSNLTGDALREQLENLSPAGICMITKHQIYSLNTSDIEFGEFDQTRTGLKTVQITFPSPIDNSETISAEIEIFVYQDEADLFENQIGHITPASRDMAPTFAIPRGATAKQFVDHINSMNDRWLEYYSASLSLSSEEFVITEDMISEFTINGDKGYCKVTYKDASTYLQFYVYEEGEENLPLASTNMPPEELFVMPAGNIIKFSQQGVFVVTNSAEVLSAQQELYQNGAEISQEELFATGGEKNYQIEFVGAEGTTVSLDMKTFVYDDSYRVPTGIVRPEGDLLTATILEDGSLDLEGLYITILYNGNPANTFGQIEGVDFERIPLSSEDVVIDYFIVGNTAHLNSISIMIEFEGRQMLFGVWSAIQGS